MVEWRSSGASRLVPADRSAAVVVVEWRSSGASRLVPADRSAAVVVVSGAVRGRPDLSRRTGRRRWRWWSSAVRGRPDLTRRAGRRWLLRLLGFGHHRGLRLYPCSAASAAPTAAVGSGQASQKAEWRKPRSDSARTWSGRRTPYLRGDRKNQRRTCPRIVPLIPAPSRPFPRRAITMPLSGPCDRSSRSSSRWIICHDSILQEYAEQV